MATWRNWSGRQSSKLDDVRFIRSEQDARALVASARQTGSTIRVAGAGHSHSALVPNDSIIVDASGLSGVIETDPVNQQALMWAGTRIYSLGAPLHAAGLGLKNQGDIDQQAITGACATGTHGTGKDLQNLSASVAGVSIILASGELLECDAYENTDIWQAARLSLGAVGLITRVRLQVREAYKLKESGFNRQYDDLVPEVPALIDNNQRFEFFWYPQTDTATAKAINETSDEPEYPVAEEGSRVAWNYEVLPNYRPHFHTEMEYSVPAEQGLACFAEIRNLLKTKFPDVSWPVEYRTVAEDEVWLSMAYQRPTVTISVHQDIREDESAYYQACEQIFLSYGGRPHWGKVNYLNGQQLAEVHPCWDQWWQVRNQYDPDGTFLNGYLRGLRP